MLLFVNPDLESKALMDLETRLASLYPAGCIEIHHALGSFENRIREKIHDIDLIILCIPDAGILAIAENMRNEIAALPLVILAGPKAAKEKKRLYGFFPRIVLNAEEAPAMIINFIKAKTNPLQALKSFKK